MSDLCTELEHYWYYGIYHEITYRLKMWEQIYLNLVYFLLNVIVPQTHNAWKEKFDCLVISQVKSLSWDKWRSVVHHVWVDSEEKYVTPIGTIRMLKLCAGNLDYHMVGTQDANCDNSNSVRQPNIDYIALHSFCFHYIHARSKCQVNYL